MHFLSILFSLIVQDVVVQEQFWYNLIKIWSLIGSDKFHVARQSDTEFVRDSRSNYRSDCNQIYFAGIGCCSFRWIWMALDTKNVGLRLFQSTGCGISG